MKNMRNRKDNPYYVPAYWEVKTPVERVWEWVKNGGLILVGIVVWAFVLFNLFLWLMGFDATYPVH